MIDRCALPSPHAGMPKPAVALNASRVTLFFYRRFPHWFTPRRICAWCGHIIAPGGFFWRGKVSHGICGPCSDEAMEQARIARRLGSVAAVFFFAAVFSVSCSRSDELAADRTFVYRPQLHASVAVPPPQRPSLEVQP